MMLTRIAPTPSGYLHKGNILSFLITRALANKLGGKVLLRIDDLDEDRCRTEYLDDIFECLNLFGICYDKGPLNTADFLEHYSQRLKMAHYKKWLDKLILTGLVYACRCSRKTLNELARDGRLRCNCYNQKLPLDTPDTALRIFVPSETQITITDELAGKLQVDLQQVVGDFVVCRRDGKPAYQLTSLIDDVDTRINYIVRGEDLVPSTAAQIYLSYLLNLPSFPSAKFLHHPLLVDAAGIKLSKSAGSESVKITNGLQANSDEVLSRLQQQADQILSAMPGF